MFCARSTGKCSRRVGGRVTDALSLADPYTVATRHWHALPDGRIQCDVCPRACKLHEGQRGLCFVRGRVDDQIVLATYGRSSGFCVDPVEKKPLNHFLPGSAVLSFGTAGCNLACRFCQNWDISKSREIDTLAAAASPGGARRGREAARLPVGRVHLQRPDRSSWSTRWTSPTPAGSAGIKAVAVSAGFMNPAPRGASSTRHMDAANIDLKAFTDDFYEKITFGKPAARCWTRWTTCGTRPTCGSRSPRCSSPATTTPTPRSRRGVRLARRAPRAGRAAALHRVPPRLQDARRAADPAGHAEPGPPDRARARPALRLHRQRARPRRPDHALPGCGEAVVVRDWYVMRSYRLRRRGAASTVDISCPAVLRRTGRRPGVRAGCRAGRRA